MKVNMHKIFQGTLPFLLIGVVASCSNGITQEEKNKSLAFETLATDGEHSEMSNRNDQSNRLAVVQISDSELHSFVGSDTLEVIASNLKTYFQSTNDGEWDQLMRHFPLHKRADTAFVNSSKRALQHWWDNGVRNRTEFSEIIYVSPAALDNDQEVILLNMKLKHFVEFHPFYTGSNPEGMKGMVESNYGKGNATFHELPLAEGDSIPFRYWEIDGLNRIWALSHVDSAHWCFLPPNFNESGAANMMGSEAMVSGLRHRRTNDPTADK
jgi:hypothetical protein